MGLTEEMQRRGGEHCRSCDSEAADRRRCGWRCWRRCRLPLWGGGDKCLLLVQSPGDYRQPGSRCLLTPSCECALTCVFSNAAVFTRVKGFLSVCAHLFMHAHLKARVWVSANVSHSVCVCVRESVWFSSRRKSLIRLVQSIEVKLLLQLKLKSKMRNRLSGSSATKLVDFKLCQHSCRQLTSPENTEPSRYQFTYNRITIGLSENKDKETCYWHREVTNQIADTLRHDEE